MPRYYFHIEDGQTILDSVGMECADLRAAQDAAIKESGQVLRNGASPKFWGGQVWRMWVTDQPDGNGEAICELHFSAVKRPTP